MIEWALFFFYMWWQNIQTIFFLLHINNIKEIIWLGADNGCQHNVYQHRKSF